MTIRVPPAGPPGFPWIRSSTPPMAQHPTPRGHGHPTPRSHWHPWWHCPAPGRPPHPWDAPLSVVDSITKARCVHDGQAQLDTLLLNVHHVLGDLHRLRDTLCSSRRHGDGGGHARRVTMGVTQGDAATPRCHPPPWRAGVALQDQPPRVPGSGTKTGCSVPQTPASQHGYAPLPRWLCHRHPVTAWLRHHRVCWAQASLREHFWLRVAPRLRHCACPFAPRTPPRPRILKDAPAASRARSHGRFGFCSEQRKQIK